MSGKDNETSFVSLPDRKTLINIYRYYGFKECEDVYNFLEYVSHSISDTMELGFIAGRTRQCLNRYDDGSRYFDELRAILLIISRQLEESVTELKRQSASLTY